MRRRPLQRRTRLAAKAGLTSRTSTLGRRNTAVAKRARDTGPPKATKDKMTVRSGGVCERCGQLRATDPHHRNGRRAGGTTNPDINNLSNLLHLCRQCHTWVTQNPLAAVGHGWSVLSWQHPADVPVLLHYGLHKLTDDGGVIALPGRCRAGCAVWTSDNECDCNALEA